MKRGIQRRTRPFTARIADVFADRALRPKLSALHRSRFYRELPRRRILVVGVQSPRRPGSLDRIFAAMAQSRHEVVTEKKDIEGTGKLDNTNILLGRHDIGTFDWIWMTDDDVVLPDNFTDDFVAMCEYAQLKIAGPAHRVWSYWSHPVTRRHQGSLARVTNYVEVGPIAALHRDTFATLLPLPSLKFGWGLDQAWPVIADRQGWKVGIVDAAPLRHTSPIGVGYDLAGAIAEAEAYMAPYGIRTGEHVLGTRTVIADIDDTAAPAGRTDG